MRKGGGGGGQRDRDPYHHPTVTGAVEKTSWEREREREREREGELQHPPLSERGRYGKQECVGRKEGEHVGAAGKQKLELWKTKVGAVENKSVSGDGREPQHHPPGPERAGRRLRNCRCSSAYAAGTCREWPEELCHGLARVEATSISVLEAVLLVPVNQHANVA